MSRRRRRPVDPSAPVVLMSTAAEEAIERMRAAIARWDAWHSTRWRDVVAEQMLWIHHARAMTAIRARMRWPELWAAWATDARVIADCEAVVRYVERDVPPLRLIGGDA